MKDEVAILVDTWYIMLFPEYDLFLLDDGILMF